jgi:hypothetical protein
MVCGTRHCRRNARNQQMLHSSACRCCRPQLFFCLPDAEEAVMDNDWALFRQIMAPNCSHAQLDAYIARLARPGACCCSLGVAVRGCWCACVCCTCTDACVLRAMTTAGMDIACRRARQRPLLVQGKHARVALCGDQAAGSAAADSVPGVGGVVLQRQRAAGAADAGERGVCGARLLALCAH